MTNVDQLTACHRAESERLSRLSEFVTQFAPAVGEKSPGHEAEIEAPDQMIEARDRALTEAFLAIERICKLSFLTEKRIESHEEKTQATNAGKRAI